MGEKREAFIRLARNGAEEANRKVRNLSRRRARVVRQGEAVSAMARWDLNERSHRFDACRDLTEEEIS